MASIATKQVPGPLARARHWARGWRERETWVAYLFILPWIIGFLAFTAGPMIASAWLPFTDYSIVYPTQNVGLDNYRELLDDPKVTTALKNNLVFALFSVPGTLIVALGLAMILARVRWGGGFFRTVFYLPNITPPVAVAILYLLLFNGSVGIINQGLEAIGISGPFWTTDPKWIKPGLAAMNVWSVGGTMVIFLAALKNVPRDLYEVASLDGAGPVRQFFTITIPMISPAIFFNVIVLTIAAMQVFDQAFLLFWRDQSNASPDSSLFYGVYLFQQAFRQFDFGFAAAMAWLLFVLVMIITAFQVKFGNRFVYYEGER